MHFVEFVAWLAVLVIGGVAAGYWLARIAER